MPERPLPLPPEHARKLAQKLADGHLALFVGAGLSHLAPRRDRGKDRLPLWKALRTAVALRCLGEEASELADPLDLFDAIEGEHDRGTLEAAIRELVDDGPYEPSAAHLALKDLPWRHVFTTNYDGLLGRVLGRRPIVAERDYDRQAREEGPHLFQIHGTADDPRTLTREDYRLWEEKHPQAYHALKDLFLYRTVLFVGYGMGDPHLDTLLETVRQITQGRERRFYAWTWQASERMRRLLENRDKIEAVSLEREEDWEVAFRQVFNALKERRAGTASAPPATLPGVDRFSYERAQYANALGARYGVANLSAMYLPGPGYARGDVLLEEIYVEPNLVVDGAEVARDLETELSLREMRAREEREERQAPQALRREQRASEVLTSNARLVLLGAPGEGKTTLLRNTLLSAVARWKEGPETEPLPVYWRLADWERADVAREGRLLKHVADTLPTLCEVGSDAITSWSTRPILWLLDGVDEIRSDAQRRAFAEDVAATARQRPADRFVVAARPPGDPSARLGAGWTRSRIEPLNHQQVDAVLGNWELVLKRKENLDLGTRELHDSLKKHPGLRRLRGNALLLTLAILFFKAHKRLPRDRYEFYEYGSRTLSDTWARSRLSGAEDVLPDERYFDALLEEIALEGMEHGVVGISRTRLEETLRTLLTARGVPSYVQDDEVARTLRAAEDLVGVLVAQGPDRFGFLHLTFQEFYAARALSKRSQEAPHYIERFWDDPDWDETWCLYVLAVQDDAARLTQLFKITLGSGLPLDHELHEPELRCLRWAGVGSYVWPAALDLVFNGTSQRLHSRQGDLLGVLEILGDWEREACGPLQPACLELLKGEKDLRQAATQALARFGNDPAIRAALLERLQDENEFVQNAAVDALGPQANDATVRAALLAHFTSKSQFVRQAAVDALGSLADDDAIRTALFERLADENEWVVKTAARALGTRANNATRREVLLAQLASNDENLRGGAALALGFQADDTTVRAVLLEQIGDRHELVRRAAALALSSQVNNTKVRAALLERLEDGHWIVRQAAADALSSQASLPDVRAALLLRLVDDSEGVRRTATGAVASQANDNEVSKALLVRLEDDDWWVREVAINALAQQANKATVRQALLARLEDENDFVRSEAAEALGPQADNSVVREALLAQLQNDEPWVRRASAAALGSQAHDTSVRTGLLGLLLDYAGFVRKSAATALRLQAQDATVRASLLARLADEDFGVRRAASSSLSLARRIV